ncbi:hypothetical protein ACLOJK_014635 [Asimina triloba]
MGADDADNARNEGVYANTVLGFDGITTRTATDQDDSTINNAVGITFINSGVINVSSAPYFDHRRLAVGRNEESWLPTVASGMERGRCADIVTVEEGGVAAIDEGRGGGFGSAITGGKGGGPLARIAQQVLAGGAGAARCEMTTGWVPLEKMIIDAPAAILAWIDPIDFGHKNWAMTMTLSRLEMGANQG